MIGVGTRAPDFALPRGAGGPTRFYGYVGGSPSVLLLAWTGDAAALAGRLREALGPGTSLHLIACARLPEDLDAFHDPEGAVHGAYGVSSATGPTAIVLDRNVRVAATQRLGHRDADLAGLVATVRELAVERPGAEVTHHAPVLLVPNALDGDLCDRLIAAWEAGDPAETGVETTADGRRVDALDHLRKRRRDLVVTDRELLRTLTSHVGRRVLPEVHKAFAYEADRFEGFKIGCYTDHDRGFFEAHRDNLSPATAHRRFALSLNLNDGYEGGGLCFPEYGPDLYRPGRGEALVFSGSHLHEVRPVTAGRRFVLLSFLFGSDARRSG